MKILVGSKNPVKLDVVKEAFEKYFQNIEVLGIDVESKVPSQPVNHETFDGAKNRVDALREINEKQNLNADYFVGIEGGIIKLYSKWFGFGCMCIMNKAGIYSVGTSSHFELPKIIYEQLLKGIELGDVIDNLTEEKNTKQKNGAIGFLTKDVITRKDLYYQGLINALIPFLNKNIYNA